MGTDGETQNLLAGCQAVETLPHFSVAHEEFIRLGKTVAPAAGFENDRALAVLALDGIALDEMAKRVGRHISEITVRLVELRVGPLGCIRPASCIPPAPRFDRAFARHSKTRIPVRQQPILSLAAIAFGSKLQRLGDRLYLSGREVSLPEVVRRARAKGLRIRYPGTDPMEDAWSGGPSRRDRRRDETVRPWEIF